VKEIPETHAAGRVDVVVIDYRPGEAEQFVFGEDGFHGALRAVSGRVIEGRDPEFQRQFAALAGFEVVVIDRIGARQALDVLCASPGHGPIFIAGRREDVIVLRVNAVGVPGGAPAVGPPTNLPYGGQ